MTATAHPWPGFGADDLARWAERNAVPATELRRLELALTGPARPSGYTRGQRPAFYVDGLRADPWHDKRDYAWTEELEQDWESIRDELFDVARRGLPPHPETRRLAAAGQWQSFELSRMGERRDENRRSCPRTVESSIGSPARRPRASSTSPRCAPARGIRPHCGPHNLRAAAPPRPARAAGLRHAGGHDVADVAGGECLLFDDSFVHEVWNTGTDARGGPLIDDRHPDLTPIEISAFTGLSPHHRDPG